MDLGLTSDYQGGTGSPEASLRAMAAAGFTHVHWCHQWSSDFYYDECEVAQIEAWLRELGLQLLDLHGSAGSEKCWWSPREYERLAGVELVKNRLQMTARLGGAAVVMHVPLLPAGAESSVECEQVMRSMDALLPTVRRLGVPLALENMPHDDFRFLRKLLSHYAPEDVGICYDSGHGNIGQRLGLDHLETVQDRLRAVHLHDNDGSGDQHRIPFDGAVDWVRLAGILADSSYAGCISMESNIWKVAEEQRGEFLADALAAGRRLDEMLAQAREKAQDTA